MLNRFKSIARTGWRPALGWTFVVIMAASAWVMVRSGTLPDYAQLAMLVGAYTPLIVARTVEKARGCS